LRPQFDIVNRRMLVMLIRMENVPPVRRSHIGGLFDRKLRTSTVLRQLEDLRRDAADIALRSLYETLLYRRVIDGALTTRQPIRDS
jgi:hypothetical protein